MIHPQNLTIPMLFAHHEATVTWDPVDGAAGYVLQRSFDHPLGDVGLTWSDIEGLFADWDAFETLKNWNAIETYAPYTVYDGIDTSYTETIPLASFAYYRVLAYDAQGRSVWTESGRVDIIAEVPPVIDGEDGDIGARYGPFEVSFVVTDLNGGDVHLTATLDGAVILDDPRIELGVTNVLAIGRDRVNFGPEPELHTIIITATDETGLTATRKYTVYTVEDLIASASFYLLRDDIPVAKLDSTLQWVDYMAVGTHTYVVRGIDRFDNYADSNPVTITIALDRVTLAPVDAPGNIFAPYVRRGEKPTNSRSISVRQEETFFEGDTLPTIYNTRQRSEGRSLSYSHLSTGEMTRLSALIGQLIVYRNQYNERSFGYIIGLDDTAFGRNISRFPAVIDYSLNLSCQHYEERIRYV